MNEKKYSKIDYGAIGNRIKELRGKMQQSEFAKIFGVEQQDVSKMENAKLKPSLDVLQSICLHFNKSMEWILTGTEKEITPESSSTPSNLIMESLSPIYETASRSTLSDYPPEFQDALRYSIKAFEILRSGTGYANALRENITWFLTAVENEKRLVRLEDELSTIKKRLSESGI